MEQGQSVPARLGIARWAAVLSITCICGWIVMEMEILGGRMLATVFGSSIYVTMGSVIGVFLLSLSVGYMLGGWFSRRTHSEALLGFSLLGAGLWLCILPFIKEPVSQAVWARGLGDEWGSLLAALILFGVPTVLLGTVSPTAIRWLTREAKDSGFRAGLVLALSTMASFAGCIVTAFYLVRFSMRLVTVVSGVALVVLGAAVAVHALRRGRVRPPAPAREDAAP